MTTDPAPTAEDYAARLVHHQRVGACGITPELWVEPGRSLVADSTVLLTRVNSTKKAHKRLRQRGCGFQPAHPPRDV